MGYWFWGDLTPVLTRLDRLEALITRQGATMANDLDALELQVRANTDAEQSAILLLTQLHALLEASKTDPARLQSVIDALGSSKLALAQAIQANTPTG